MPSHASKHRLGLVFLVAIFLLGLARPMPAWSAVIGSGREQEILALLGPYQDGGPVGAGARLTNIAITAQRVVVTLTDQDGAQGTVVLTPLDTPEPHRAFRTEASASTSNLIRDAQARLQAAVAANDVGQPVAAPPRAGPLRLPAPPPFAWPAEMRWLLPVVAVLWLGLLAAVLLVRSPMPLPPLPRWRARALGVALFGAAYAARVTVPFWPLHANDHYSHDIAIALQIPGVVSSDELRYGLAWTALQQWTVPLFGAHHDGLAHWSAVIGALAAAVTFAAAWRVSRHLPLAFLAGLFVALAPASVRVGHSESPFVVAQLLFAAVLFVSTGRPGALRTAGLAAGVALLAAGHPLGPGYAAAAGLLAWSLPQEGPEPPRIRTLVVLGLAVLCSAAAGWLMHGAVLQARLHTLREGRTLIAPWRSFLWGDSDWAPQVAWPLFCAGITGLALERARLAWWRPLSLLAGLALLGWTSTLVASGVADKLRYQAPCAVVAALGIALAARLWRDRTGAAWQVVRVAVLACACATALLLLWPLPGAQALDAQGHAWSAMRRAFANEHGELTFVTARAAAGSGVCLEPPVGAWRASGPRSRVLPADTAEALCRRNGALPANTWVVYEPGCGVSTPDTCRALDRFAGPIVFRASTPVLEGGEFLDFATKDPGLRIAAARCPP